MGRTNGKVLADLKAVGLDLSEVLYRLGDALRDWIDGDNCEAADLVEMLTCGAVDALGLAERFAPDLAAREAYAAAIAVIGALPGGPGVQPELSAAVRAGWERDNAIPLERAA